MRRPRASRRRRLLGAGMVAAVVATTALTGVAGGPSAAAAPAAAPAVAATAATPCGEGGNPVACENTKPGTPQSVWDVAGAGEASIQGFATDISVDVGKRIDFKVDTDARAYDITIYRTGYYGGDGARQVATVNPSASLPQVQPPCITDLTTELYDCGNWGVSASWTVPETAVSGVYIARLRRPDNNDASHITFVVRDDDSTSDVVFQTSDPTWQAYNLYGGSNFYRGAGNGRAYKISYNRPMMTRDGPGGRDFYFANEFPMVRFLERNGYDVSYLAGVDTDRSGALLLNHDVFLSVGHDEYWSGAQRANVEAARDAGVHLQFLSGNEVYWRTRYEPSADASHTAYRTLVSYKETWDRAKIDPSPEWTGTWRDPRYASQSAGAGLPENGLTGTAYVANNSDLPLTVTAAEGRTRLWRHTSLATASGPTALAPHTVGYESDEDLDNGFRPPGLIRLSTTTGPVSEYLQDFGNNVAPGTHTHHLTLYRAASGALVFGAGTVQWTWGLDAVHDTPFDPEPADPRMQQAQVNLFADMGVQPATLQAGLVAATPSTDTTGPTVAVTAPAEGAARANGVEVTISGTATDAGGGRVAGVEYSTDGGTSWHPATGTTSWSATYRQRGQGAVPVQVRGVDDSANIGPAVTRTLTVSCPCTVLGGAVPPVAAAADSNATELGLRFTPVIDGFVTGARFFKGVGNGGTHVGSLWTSGGTRLATATFAAETATGWQEVSFSSAVAVTAGQTYVVSYTAPQGRYAVEPGAFWASGIEAPPLRVAGGFGTEPAGVFGDAGRFPASSYQRGAYAVDVLFDVVDRTPLILTDRAPYPDSTSVPTAAPITARLSRAAATGPSVTVRDPAGAAVPGTTSYSTTTRVVSFTPSAPLAHAARYTVTVAATDTLGNPVQSGATWSFTTAQPPGVPGVCPCSLFDDSTQPTLLEDSDPKAVTLGVRFSPTVAGSVTAVRFYKGPGNTGSHTGVLWSLNGTRLAQGTFTDESVAGWQTLTFATPVDVTAGTEYVASYRTTVGRYSASPGAFGDADLSRPPLRVTRTAGAYSYPDAFPSNASSASYLVDVVFVKAPPVIAVVAQDPAAGATSVPRWAPVKVDFSAPLTTGWSLTVTRDSDGTTVPGTTALNAAGTRLTFTPSAIMPADTLLTARLNGVRSVDGADLPPQTWTFRTRSPDPTTAQTMFSDHVPQTTSSTDGAAVELGTAFRVARSGTVTAIRFFKGAGNTGTHTGSLWTSTGTRLATVTFADETASGWQTAILPTPVELAPATTYVVSYFAPQGHYASTPGFFATAFTNGDLTAPNQSNGRYLYGASGGFPPNSYGSANYFVDVVFAPTPATVSVTGRTPAPGATGVSREVTPSLTLSAPVADGWSMTLRQGTTAVPATAARSADGTTLTLTPAAILPGDTDLTVEVSGVVSTDGAVLPTQSWTFRTETAAPTGTSLFTGLTPSVPDVNDNAAVELGTVVTPSVNGSITRLLFYKGAGNTGTHVGSVWSMTGTRLAQVTFTNETATGWQVATLPTPVPVTAGQSYVVSYLAPRGHYSATQTFFNRPWTVGPLTAPSGSNGRYVYGAAGGFPTGSHRMTNYFVDLVFRPAP